MGYRQLLQTVFPLAPAREDPKERSRRRVEWSRKAILNGWIISMISIVAYCWAMLGDDNHAASLFEHGLIGWGAVSFFLIGVGLWLSGSVVFLSEANRFPEEEEKED